MNSEPTLDIIIGQSTITRNNFSSNYENQACAFPSGGFLSIISLKGSERHDIILSNTTTTISAISFSKSGNSIAVGESGVSSRVFILTFPNDKYDEVESKIIVNTKEKGFSCLALDYANKRLITVGYGDQPFLLLWDLKKAKPTILGHYCLPTVPTHISIGENIALVSGNKMLKVIHLIASHKGKPVLLKVTNANIGNFKNSKFVSVSCQPTACYALTSTGTICSFSPRNISTKLTLKMFNTNRGTTTSMSADEKLIVCGTTKGSILGIKRTIPLHLFGSFLSPGKSVVAVGVLKSSLVAAYNDGCILFWKRKLNTMPRLSFSSSSGPICSIELIHGDSVLISTGNDGFIRAWEITTKDGNSTQALIGENQIKKFERDLKSISGIRCVTSGNNDKHLFAGDDNGSLYKINAFNLQIMNELRDNSQSIHCISAHHSLPLIATGGGDGTLRVYNISSDNIVLSMAKEISKMPLNSLTFTETGIVCSSSEKLFFCRLPDLSCSVYSEYDGKSAFMSLSYAKQAKLVFAACQNMSLFAFDTNNGKLFRTYVLSYSDFPIKALVHPSGLIIATAMSDGTVLIIDTMSGEIVLSFQTFAGMITDMIFHKNDIIVSTFGGCLMRWKLPDEIHKILDNKSANNNEDKKVANPGTNALATSSIFKSILGSNNPLPQWVFKEISENSSPQNEEEIQGDAAEDESNINNKQEFNDYSNQNENQINLGDEKVENDDKNNEILEIFRKSFRGKKDIMSINEGKKLLSIKKDSLLNNADDNESENDNDNDNDNQEKEVAVPSPPVVDKRKSNEINELAMNISNLMKKAKDYLDMQFIDQREITAQNQLKEVVNELNPPDEEFEAKYKHLTEYSNELLKHANELQDLAKKTRDCSINITKTIDSL